MKNSELIDYRAKNKRKQAITDHLLVIFSRKERKVSFRQLLVFGMICCIM